MKKIVLCSIAALLTANLSVTAMNAPIAVGRDVLEKRAREVLLPIKMLATFDPLNRENGEFDFYKDQTWNETKSLEANKALVVEKFFTTCCIIHGGDSGVKINERLSGEKLRFCGLSEQEIAEFYQTICKIADDSVGCKLLRLLTAKYGVMENRTKFSVIHIAANEDVSSFRFGHGQSSDQSTIENIFQIPRKVPLIGDQSRSMFARKSGCDIGLFEDSERNYKDCDVFSCLIRLLHMMSSVDVSSQSHECIFKRLILADYGSSLDVVGGLLSLVSDPKSLTITTINTNVDKYKQMLLIHYANDYEFRKNTGFFIDSDGQVGFDPLNVSAYLYSTRRIVPLESCSFDIGQTDKAFFEKFAELSHARYYLEGAAKLPCFGFGQYKYVPGS